MTAGPTRRRKLPPGLLTQWQILGYIEETLLDATASWTGPVLTITAVGRAGEQHAESVQEARRWHEAGRLRLRELTLEVVELESARNVTVRVCAWPSLRSEAVAVGDDVITLDGLLLQIVRAARQRHWLGRVLIHPWTIALAGILASVLLAN